MPWEHDHNGDKWWDWHDYREAACALNALGEDIHGSNYSFGNIEQDGLVNWSVANGGQLIDVENKTGSWNTPEFIEGQNFAVDMICQDGCMLNVDDYLGQGQALGLNPWVAGKLGITSRGDLRGVAQSNADLTQVAWVRSPQTGKSAGLGSMHFHIASKQSQHPEQAFDFMMYLANFENQKNIALSGTAEPINADVWRDADYQATWGGPEAVEARLDALDNFIFTPQLPGVLNGSGKSRSCGAMFCAARRRWQSRQWWSIKRLMKFWQPMPDAHAQWAALKLLSAHCAFFRCGVWSPRSRTVGFA